MITEKLLAVQSALKAPKTQFNAFGKYKYRKCEDILEAVKPLNTANGLCLTLSDELVMIGERYYIKATATLSDGTDTITTTAYAREEAEKKGMDGSQVTGASSSYARKYALNGLYNIDDNADSDTTNDGEAKKSEPKPAGKLEPKETESDALTEDDIKSLTEKLKDANNAALGKEILKEMGYAKLKELPHSRVGEFLLALMRRSEATSAA